MYRGEYVFLYHLIETSFDYKWHLQTVWSQIRRRVTRRLIQLQTVWHSDFKMFINHYEKLRYFELCVHFVCVRFVYLVKEIEVPTVATKSECRSVWVLIFHRVSGSWSGTKLFGKVFKHVEKNDTYRLVERNLSVKTLNSFCLPYQHSFFNSNLNAKQFASKIRIIWQTSREKGHSDIAKSIDPDQPAR